MQTHEVTVINALAHAEALLRVKMHEADLIEAFAAGATDYLTKPIKPTLVRSRVRA
jgi:DNA-binding response OmpR family regulator